MWIIIFLFASLVFAQNDVDLSPVKTFEKKLSDQDQLYETVRDHKKPELVKNRPPIKLVSMEEIRASEKGYGAIGPGTTLYHLKGVAHQITTEHFYSRFYRLEDELGYRYLISNDGSVNYKVKSENIESIEDKTSLYVPPLRYTPAPLNISKSEYDKKLLILPEAIFYVGVVNGDYMRDLFNDHKASRGISTQYGLQAFTGWDLPIRTGLVLHYEKATYDLSGNGSAVYSSFSMGPQFKSRETQIFGEPWRAQVQFRVSPFSRVDAQTENGNLTMKFNSADLLFSAEHPLKNAWGEFVLGIFFQSQWLNIKDQPEIVSVKASNETNKTFGLSFAQVFE